MEHLAHAAKRSGLSRELYELAQKKFGDKCHVPAVDDDFLHVLAACKTSGNLEHVLINGMSLNQFLNSDKVPTQLKEIVRFAIAN